MKSGYGSKRQGEWDRNLIMRTGKREGKTKEEKD